MSSSHAPSAHRPHPKSHPGHPDHPRRPHHLGLAALALGTLALVGVAAPRLGIVGGSPETSSATLQSANLQSAPVSVDAPTAESGPVQVPARSHRERPVLDEDSPSVANLDPDLLAALRAAATHAATDGVRFTVNSGWRSPEHQAELLEEAAEKYGSEQEAARWVATPDKSEHVSGDAVDLGGPEATQWLSEHGSGHGLCQIYRNEPWHFELRPDAPVQGCPTMYADPTEDPRMQ